MSTFPPAWVAEDAARADVMQYAESMARRLDTLSSLAVDGLINIDIWKEFIAGIYREMIIIGITPADVEEFRQS